MEMNLLKELFDEGVLTSVEVYPAPMTKGYWSVLVNRTNGKTVFLSKNRSSEEKEYKRITAALKDARRIGFRTITIKGYD